MRLSSAVSIFCVLALFIQGCSIDQSSTDLAIIHAPVTDPVTPTVNQSIILTAEVENLSGDYSSTTVVAIRIDGQEILRLPLNAMAGGSSRQITTAFTIPTVGAHSVAVIVDPDQQINDASRDNNVFIFSITVGSIVAG